MATYAIGDLQGCFDEFQALLAKVNFGPDDELWLLGDLINRGPKSLQTLRYVKALDSRCRVVLGNHDLHFLAIYYGGHSPSRSDTFDEILAAPDVAELAQWLRQQHLVYRDRSLGYVMAHAGIPHIWSVDQAEVLAAEVTNVISGDSDQVSYSHFFTHMYGDEPSLWDDTLDGMPRLRLITNYLTRMRLVNASGALEFRHKGLLEDVPSGWQPWFDLVRDDEDANGRHEHILFGHWAALDGHTGNAKIHALDTGCVWGRQLTALCLENETRFSVSPG